jgi:hypothetical protein
MFKELHRGGGTSVRGVIGRSGARIGAKAHSLHPTLIMVRLRLQCVMSILLGSTGLLIAQQQAPVQGQIPKTVPAQVANQQQKTARQTSTASQARTGKSTAVGSGAVKRPVKGKPRATKKTQEIVQAQPAPPPPPPTLEQMPAQPPQVRFAGGLLTVEANNSTLGDVMTAIRRQTGASLELPPSAGAERIMAHLGPAQPREVIASLLNGSNFDYIILGSLQRPGGLDKIIITARQNQAGGAPTAVAQNPGMRQPQQPAAEDSEGEGGDAPDREVDNASEPEPEQPQEQPAQPAQQGVPGPQPGAPGQPPAQQQAQPEGEGQQQVKTPEQLLRELQQMRQQQQQQQQQQNQGEGAQPQDTPNNPPQ